jgi:phage baseplate assembly protein W
MVPCGRAINQPTNLLLNHNSTVSNKNVISCNINTCMVTFIGFSTIGKRTGTRTLEDKELAKRDLLNHFYTRRGERLGEPEFGSILPELIFEQFDQFVIDAADDDVRRIIDLDPRWRLRDYNIDSDNQNLTITVQLEYVPNLSNDTLVLEYTRTEEI